MSNLRSTQIDWSPLNEELRHWTRDNRHLPLWWRDDDAVEHTAAFDHLSALAEDVNMPVHLAIIPARVSPIFAANLPEHCIPVVHGWGHHSYAQAAEKKSEFPQSRPLMDRKGDATTALTKLTALLGPRLVPIFVPPWNRIAADLVPQLASIGYRGLSTFKPRTLPMPAPGLVQVNTHIDPINWRGDRSLVSPTALIADLVDTLRQRRTGDTDATEPLGLLTHHLVHDPAIWAFTEGVIKRLLDGPATAHTPLAHQTGPIETNNKEPKQT
ncbi:polysaccharide deacetylase family protein [Tritonibacter litoralis]|uniref:polysaccharide deacetylase family protein n=1 Tax=Tritonibacter litoralis TaxID=2662264 RepID=UPI001FEBFE6D|nr:polysaccharide deacetylase family protein [Tritonibacter litoralis]